MNKPVKQASGPKAARHGGAVVSGLEFLQGTIADGAWTSNFCQMVGIRLVEAEPGRTVYEAAPGEGHMNALGIVHGGLAATLIDAATGSAVLSMQPKGARSTTLELNVNFVRPMTAATGRVTCEGKVIHVGRRVGTSEARVVDGQGKLIAHGTATMMLFPADEAERA
jgi:uncharacterized protein (TIGR00369 family)